MTTKIWNEKPEEKCFTGAGDYCFFFYSSKEMDAWLEKIKERLDLLESIEGTELVGLFGIDGSGLTVVDKYKIAVLEEKAEKWDNIMEKSMEAPYIDCVGNLEKLEAVHQLLKKVRDRDEIRVDRSWIITSLEKILEAEA